MWVRVSEEVTVTVADVGASEREREKRGEEGRFYGGAGFCEVWEKEEEEEQ